MGLFDFRKTKSSEATINLSDLKFISNDHIRYQSGRDVSGHNKDCWRGIRVQNNIQGGQGYTVTIYNLDGNHPVWGNNIQMAPKQMKITEHNNSFIKLKGYGADTMGNSFADYGLTLHLSAGDLEKVTLHMFDRNVDIVYFKANSTKSSSEEIAVQDIEDEFSKGVEAITNGDNNAAVRYFTNALTLKYNSGFVNDDWESCCCFNLGEALKQLMRYDEAISYYQKAIEKKKLNEDAYTSLAECYFGLETTEGLENVVKTLTKCTSLFPNNETAHYNSGIAYFKLGDMKKALNSFERSLDLGNEDADMYVSVLRKHVN